MPKPLRWFSRQFAHRTVDFVLTCKEMTPALKGHLGYSEETSDGRVTVWICAASPRDVQDVTALHEALHVAAWDLNIDEEVEEIAFSAAEPVWPVLVS